MVMMTASGATVVTASGAAVTAAPGTAVIAASGTAVAAAVVVSMITVSGTAVTAGVCRVTSARRIIDYSFCFVQCCIKILIQAMCFLGRIDVRFFFLLNHNLNFSFPDSLFQNSCSEVLHLLNCIIFLYYIMPKYYKKDFLIPCILLKILLD